MWWPYRCREKAAGDGEPHWRAISTGESGAVVTHMLLGRRRHGERRPTRGKGGEVSGELGPAVARGRATAGVESSWPATR
jgi:hypothetical protein